MVKIIECPRDAMQGLPDFIPTDVKVSYINSLLKVGFDTIDFGSFVSPKAIPQMRDTAEVLCSLDMSSTKSKLLAIIANIRGAKDACQFDQITYLGYPHSVSPTFLMKNINSDEAGSLEKIQRINELCLQSNKELVVYISMGFGNPYGDEWNVNMVEDCVGKLKDLGIKIIPLSDTTGQSTIDGIGALFSKLISAFPNLEFGFHLHTNIADWHEQIDVAFNEGCRRFDTVVLGLGGCPMAEDDLVGNMKTVNLIEYFDEKGVDTGLNKEAFEEAYVKSLQVFHNYLV
ncbi:MAG TPA: hydroxymethylglutaryl-CoA lyase [Flavobacteriales bacterium]|nr:hydroxymethylglutaryl-CoA lyase [Flavobacteriales bacterium]